MKKLLAVLGATSLIASTGVTVVACGPLNNGSKQPDFSKFNNSLPNMQGAASTWAKQLILSDQYNLSIPTMKTSLGRLKAKDVVKANTGLEFDPNDFNLNENSDLTDLNDQYFGNHVNLDNIRLTGDINLKGTIGENQDQLWKFLKDKLGIDLGSNSDLISGIIGTILPTLNSATLMELIKQILPELNGSGLEDLLNQLGLSKDLIPVISYVLKIMFGNQDFVNQFALMIDNFDIGTNYSDMKVADISSAALISLSNAIGMFVEPTYQAIEIKKEDASDSKKIFTNLISAGEKLGKTLATKLVPTAETNNLNQGIFDIKFFENDFENNIIRYVTAVANLFQFLEFIQLQFSLFDSTKDYEPTDSNYLFSAADTNKKYLQKVLGSGQTLRDVTDTPEGENVQGALNLKYLLSIFKNTFNSLDNYEDQNGYSIQKFLIILLISPTDVNISDFNDDTLVSPMSGFLGEILLQIIGEFLKKVEGVPVSIVLTLLNKPIKFLLTATFEVLLISPEQNLTDVLIILLDKLKYLLPIVGNNIPDPILSNGIKAIKTYWDKGLQDILAEILNKVPLLNSHHLFQELYSGNPLQLEELINYLKAEQLSKKLKEIYSEDDKEKDPLGKLFTFLSTTLEVFVPTLNNILPNGLKLNLKNLLITPLNKINNSSIIPPAFGGYYLNKSVIEIIDDVCKKLNVTGKEKLVEIPDNFNFKLSYLKDIFEMIVHYNYQGIPEKNRGQNLISIILDNLDQVSTILGLQEDGTFGEGSILHLIFHKILNIEKIGNDGTVDNDPFKFLAILLSSIFNNLNEPNLDNTEAFKNLFFAEDAFKFEYQTPIKDDDGTFLGQVIIINYHNSENNSDWVYTLNYAREKVSDYFQLLSLKKVISEPK